MTIDNLVTAVALCGLPNLAVDDSSTSVRRIGYRCIGYVKF